MSNVVRVANAVRETLAPKDKLHARNSPLLSFRPIFPAVLSHCQTKFAVLRVVRRANAQMQSVFNVVGVDVQTLA